MLVNCLPIASHRVRGRASLARCEEGFRFCAVLDRNPRNRYGWEEKHELIKKRNQAANTQQKPVNRQNRHSNPSSLHLLDCDLIFNAFAHFCLFGFV